MRPTKDLDFMIDSAIRVSGGTCPFDLLALDAEEVAYFQQHLKGRRGAKHIGIHKGKPGDELPIGRDWDSIPGEDKGQRTDTAPYAPAAPVAKRRGKR